MSTRAAAAAFEGQSQGSHSSSGKMFRFSATHAGAGIRAVRDELKKSNERRSMRQIGLFSMAARRRPEEVNGRDEWRWALKFRLVLFPIMNFVRQTISQPLRNFSRQKRPNQIQEPISGDETSPARIDELLLSPPQLFFE